jgi:hypothetical protein
LIVINHGDAIMRKDVSVARLLRMLSTMAVPYLVSTASSVGALRERSQHTADHLRSPLLRVDCLRAHTIEQQESSRDQSPWPHRFLETV